MKKPDRSAWISPDDPPKSGEAVIVCAKDAFLGEVVIDKAYYLEEPPRFAGTKFRVWRKDDKNLYGWAPLPPRIGRRVKA